MLLPTWMGKPLRTTFRIGLQIVVAPCSLHPYSHHSPIFYTHPGITGIFVIQSSVMNILELKGLKKYFATQKAVDDISFSVARGQIFGLLGPNGAGKTTLIRMITGIFYPDEGQIILDGKPFDPIQDIGHIGYMPEERGLYKKMEIGEQALYLAQLKGLSKADAMHKIKQWFVRFQMESWWNKKVEDLSKGMQQKLQFVITVLHEPKLIILDEPFSGLDPVNSNLIKDEIFNLAKGGSTIIFSTHRMEQVEEICDHIVLVNKGNKILDGTVKQVKQDFKENLFSIGAPKIPAGGVLAPYDLVGENKQLHIVKIKEGSRPNDVLQYLLNQGVEINSFNELLPSLSDIFIKLVEGTPTARQFQNVPV
jgi:ABC-2 type transport system ATP-binding protein